MSAKHNFAMAVLTALGVVLILAFGWQLRQNARRLAPVADDGQRRRVFGVGHEAGREGRHEDEAMSQQELVEAGVDIGGDLGAQSIATGGGNDAVQPTCAGGQASPMPCRRLHSTGRKKTSSSARAGAQSARQNQDDSPEAHAAEAAAGCR